MGFLKNVFDINFSFWYRKWQPTPVFLPGKSHELRILVGYIPWGRKESDMTERLHFHFLISICLLCNHPLYFFSLITLLRFLMVKSNISLGQCHIAFENMCYFQISFDNIDFWHNPKVIREQTLYDFNTFRSWTFLHLVLCPWIWSSVS